jgi:hypothetical protein
MLLFRLTDSLADISTNISKEAVEVFVAKGRHLLQNVVIFNGIDTQ